MPVVEKIAGGSVYLRSEEASLSIGDTIDVSEAKAAYLCEDRGDFERVEEIERKAEEVKEALVSDPEELIDAGVCPWCDDYEGDGVPQHASAAHPDEWAEYKED